jgi:hypothetical protein
MSSLSLVFACIGRLYAIRCALGYDLQGNGCELTGAAAVLWRTNMEAWRLATMESR